MSLKFLIVDDSLTMRRIVANSLKNLGYENFVEAVDGNDALNKLGADDSINFVITDWNMPGLSGLDLLKAIRSNDKLKNLPVLMVTTRGVKEDIVEAMNAKVNNYIVKPFTPQVLKEKITQILENSQ
ncbi:response regulator [Melioribacteraceae bacterium 4301-Me]|uniref:response regulator n=1 Tax=Pyranulibacter aquaticus TaxID=3163344 RepID=UPI0035997AF6